MIELDDRNGAISQTTGDVTDSLLPGNEDAQFEVHIRNNDTVAQTPQERNYSGRKDMRSLCTQHVFWKCNLWMVIASAFVFLLFLIILSLVLYSMWSGRCGVDDGHYKRIFPIYTDDDGYESLTNGSAQYYTGTVKINDQCINSERLAAGSGDGPSLSAELTQRISDVFKTSPALGHYFRSAEIVSLSDDDNVATYNLQFMVPSGNSNFLKYMMSEEFVRGVLRQDVFDQEPNSCQPVLLDPSSITLSFLRRDEGMTR